MIVDKSIKQ